MEIRAICPVCGEEIDPAEGVVITPTGAIVHPGEDGCEGRYWDPPDTTFGL